MGIAGFTRRALGLVLIAWSFGCVSVGSVGTASVPAPAPSLLPDAGQVSGTLEPGTSRTWRIEPEIDLYLRLRLDPPGAGARVEIRNADGEVLAVTVAEIGNRKPLRLPCIVPAGQVSQLRVESPPGGNYSLMVIENRQAREGDESRVAGLSALNRATYALRNGLTREEYRAILSSLQDAATYLETTEPTHHAHALIQEANVHLHLEDPMAAIEPARKAQKILTAVGQPSGRELGWLAEAYATEASALDDLGDTTEAPGLLTKAIKIYERWDERGASGKAVFLNNRALAYKKLEDFTQAESDYLAALQIWRDKQDRRREVTTLLNLANLYRAAGRLPEALALFEEARPLVQSAAPDSRLHLNTTLGRFYIAMGRLDEARELLQEGLTLARQKERKTFEAAILNHLGLLYRILGKPQESEVSHRSALRIFKALEDEPRVAKTTVDLGRALRQQAQLAEAGALFDLGLSKARALGFRAIQVEASVELALTHSGAGRHPEARSTARTAASLAEEAPTPTRISALLALGEVNVAAGLPALAEAPLSQVLQLSRIEEVPLSLARAHALLGTATWQTGDLEAAQAHLSKALDIYEQIRGHLASPESRTHFLARWHRHYLNLVDVLMRLDEEKPGQGFAAQALEISERSRARTLVEMLSEARVEIHRGIDPELRDRERLLGDQLALLRVGLAEASNEGEEGQLTVLQNALYEATRSYGEVEAKIRDHHAAYAALRYPEPLTLGEIQGLIPDGTLLLEYALGAERSFLFAVGPHSFQVHELPNSSTLRNRVDAIRDLIAREDIRLARSLNTRSRQLWSTLLEPVLDAPSPPQRLWIVADGPLHFLPFELLQNSDGQFAIETVEIGYIQSASTLVALPTVTQRLHTSPLFVAFAQPSGGGLAHFGLPELPGTLEEVNGIAELLPDTSRLYLGPDANEDNLARDPAVRTARWVHFATHGWIREDAPLQSGLVLSPTSEGDYLLQAAEVFDLDFSAELVVLSACETGLGEAVDGEGIIGLTRAFLYAGSYNIVVSLWPVGDRSTRLLMQNFYSRLAAGMEPAHALQLSKQVLIAQGFPAQAWAPFILIGGLYAAEEVQSLTSVGSTPMNY